MADAPATPDPATQEKLEKLQKAYDEFIIRLRGLEAEQLETMKRVLGRFEQEEIQKVLDSLKNA